MRTDFIIYGASGHGRVIADIVELNGNRVLGFVDDNSDLWNTRFNGYPVLGGRDFLLRNSFGRTRFIVAVGDNETRKSIVIHLTALGLSFDSAIHPSACIAKDVQISLGTVVMANVVVNPGSKIGAHSILNTACSVDHDCILHDFVHLSPGVHTGGGVTIGELSWIGIGAAISNNVTIGMRVIVGAGAVVIRDVEDSFVMVGNPARFLKQV